MIDLSLFRRPAMVSATTASLAIGVGITAMMSFLPTVLQRALHYSALHAAFEVLPWAVTTFVVAYAARRLSPRISTGFRLAAGLVITAVGLLLTLGLHSLFVGLVVAGVGTGLGNATIGGAAVAAVPASRGGMGSGINHTARYLGAAVGVTVVFVLSVRPGYSLVAGWDLSVVVISVLIVAAAGVVAVCSRSSSVSGASVVSGSNRF